MDAADRLEVAVGVIEGDQQGDGISIAGYAAANEFGTENIPARPFMATSFDENLRGLQTVMARQHAYMLAGQKTARVALKYSGSWLTDKIQTTIENRNFLPKLADSTIAAKKGSTKTLIDTGAMKASIHPSVRPEGSSE